MKTPLLAAALIVAAWQLPLATEYHILIHSPESWARYYQLIGLGTVDMIPVSANRQAKLEQHCRFLAQVTGHRWVPLGYSIERGYKLCYRTSPYRLEEARVLCARLVMHVKHNSGERIVCENTVNRRLRGQAYTRVF